MPGFSPLRHHLSVEGQRLQGDDGARAWSKGKLGSTIQIQRLATDFERFLVLRAWRGENITCWKAAILATPTFLEVTTVSYSLCAGMGAFLVAAGSCEPQEHSHESKWCLLWRKGVSRAPLFVEQSPHLASFLFPYSVSVRKSAYQDISVSIYISLIN